MRRGAGQRRWSVMFALLATVLTVSTAGVGCGGSSRPACSATNPTGECAVGASCLGGLCCLAADACGSVCCGSGSTCVSGACCPTASACGANCCDTGSTCVDDGNGNLTCAQSCTDSNQCPAAKPCCAPFSPGGTGPATGAACFATGTVAGQACLCSTAAECASGVCGESSDSAGNPTGLYICVANDGLPYDGCNSGVACQSGYCCVTLTGNGSSICEEPCHDASQCGTATGVECSTLTSGSCSGSPGACE